MEIANLPRGTTITHGTNHFENCQSPQTASNQSNWRRPLEMCHNQSNKAAADKEVRDATRKRL
eukprot:COSAG02_NODE_190_length_30025_cov_22.989875_17_plen_63_part_00